MLREKLKDSSVIIIAPHLNTIRHYDKVLVFEEGRGSRVWKVCDVFLN